MMLLLTLLFDALVMLVSIKLISGKDDDELSIPNGMIISFIVAVVTIAMVFGLVEVMGIGGILIAVAGGSVVLALAVIKVFNVEPGKAILIAAIFGVVKLIREFAFAFALVSTANQTAAMIA